MAVKQIIVLSGLPFSMQILVTWNFSVSLLDERISFNLQTQSLTYLTKVLHHHGNTLNDLQKPHSDVRDTVTQLLTQWEEEWTGEIIFSKCLTHLIELSKLLIPQFRNEDFLKVCNI